MALVYADLNLQQSKEEAHVWIPLGRFSWKFRSYGPNPLKAVIDQGEKDRASWEPLRKDCLGVITKVLIRLPPLVLTSFLTCIGYNGLEPTICYIVQ